MCWGARTTQFGERTGRDTEVSHVAGLRFYAARGPNADCDSRFVHQHDEEYSSVKKARRPGRPPSTREVFLKVKIEALDREHRDGFCRLSRDFKGRTDVQS